MTTDRLKQFVELRDSLLKEKAGLERRLSEINDALGCDDMSAETGRKGRRSRKVQNSMSLKEAVRRVTSARPLTKTEILDAIQKIGYRFGGKDPINSLNVILYTKGNFKNKDGKFSPLK